MQEMQEMVNFKDEKKFVSKKSFDAVLDYLINFIFEQEIEIAKLKEAAKNKNKQYKIKRFKK